MERFITIGNEKERIVETNYFQTELGAAGYCYLTFNAGAARLLLPPTLKGLGPRELVMRELLTAHSVDLELSGDRAILWFNDNTDTPFRIDLDAKQLDRKLPRSEEGKAITLYIYSDTLQMLAKFPGKILFA